MKRRTKSAFEILLRKKEKPSINETKQDDFSPNIKRTNSEIHHSEERFSSKKKTKKFKNKIQKKLKMMNRNGHSSQPVEEESLGVIATQDLENNHSKDNVPCGNLESDKCLSWLIYPVPIDLFFLKTWEKKPLHIKDRVPNYYTGIFSCAEFDRIMRQNHLKYNTNLTVVSYLNGEKQVIAADGRVYAAVLWHHFQCGHTVQFMNPQTYSKPLWKLCSLLQEFFGSFTGVNMYLTPPDSQGFAPHYDDIEAFVLQIEGSKHWKVYAPRSENETLPRLPSKDFKEEEIGEPILEVELQPGDLLYFPRGFIHQAKTNEDVHSLHLTISTNQKNTWGDLLQLVLPQALQVAMENSIEYRESLPKDYMNYMGIACNDDTEPDWNSNRHTFVKKLNNLTKGLAKYIFSDACADLMAKDYIHSALPPCLTQDEKNCSIHSNNDMWKDGQVSNVVEIDPDDEIRLIRKRAVRLVKEGEDLRLYHCLENTRIFKENEPQYVQIEPELAPAAEALIQKYPEYIRIAELPLNTLEMQLDIATLLHDKGLVQLKQCPIESEESS